MIRPIAPALSVAIIACGSGRASPPAEVYPIGPLAAVAPADLCVTHGTVEAGAGAMQIDQPTVRAVVPGAHGDAAELSFVYRGVTARTRALASGQQRHQLGLKLRAADGCNLVYVMWRLGPGLAGVEVSVKRNPGKHTNAACGVRGYRKIRPAKSAPVPALQVGTAHTLAAEIHGDDLVARVDGAVVWRGSLHGAADAVRGSAGLRTDNVALGDVVLRAARSTARSRSVAVRCRQVVGLAGE